MMKPEPSELTRRGVGVSPFLPLRFLKNSSKNSSNGEPGGSCGIAWLLISTVCLVEILTTASITCSAISAMPSGPRAAAGAIGQAIAPISKIVAAGRRTSIGIREKSAPMGVGSPCGNGVAGTVLRSLGRFKGKLARQPHHDNADQRRADSDHA